MSSHRDAQVEDRLTSSVRNKILIAFVLILIAWAGAVNITFQYVHESLLQDYSIDPEIMRQMVRNFILFSGGTTAGMIALAFVIALALSYRITYPIKELIRGARQVAEGNLDVSIPVQSRDEIGALAAAFNRMAAQRKQAEETISTSLAEKEILLREIHHRVKNNLAVISSLLTMQARRVEGLRNVRAFEDSRNRVTAMALIHEKLYRSADLSSINVEEYLRSLVQKLMESYGVAADSIRMELDVRVPSMSIDRLVPCGLIVNELVSNALKYAFLETENGVVTVSLVPEADGYILSVHDNGDGIPGDMDITDTGTLGLQIVDSLATQLGGSLEIRREKGTTLAVSFPE